MHRKIDVSKTKSIAASPEPQAAADLSQLKLPAPPGHFCEIADPLVRQKELLKQLQQAVEQRNRLGCLNLAKQAVSEALDNFNPDHPQVIVAVGNALRVGALFATSATVTPQQLELIELALDNKKYGEIGKQLFLNTVLLEYKTYAVSDLVGGFKHLQKISALLKAEANIDQGQRENAAATVIACSVPLWQGLARERKNVSWLMEGGQRLLGVTKPAESLYRLGNAMAGIGNLKRASKVLGQALRHHGRDYAKGRSSLKLRSDILESLGLVMLRRGRYDQAEKAFLRGLALDNHLKGKETGQSKREAFKMHLGRLYERQGSDHLAALLLTPDSKEELISAELQAHNSLARFRLAKRGGDSEAARLAALDYLQQLSRQPPEK